MNIFKNKHNTTGDVLFGPLSFSYKSNAPKISSPCETFIKKCLKLVLLHELESY